MVDLFGQFYGFTHQADYEDEPQGTKKKENRTVGASLLATRSLGIIFRIHCPINQHYTDFDISFVPGQRSQLVPGYLMQILRSIIITLGGWFLLLRSEVNYTTEQSTSHR